LAAGKKAAQKVACEKKEKNFRKKGNSPGINDFKWILQPIARDHQLPVIGKTWIGKKPLQKTLQVYFKYSLYLFFIQTSSDCAIFVLK